MVHGISRDESNIRPTAEVLSEARATGQKIHIGALMVIVSMKRYEKSPAEWSIKARIVFRGDAVRDEDNQAAVFDRTGSICTDESRRSQSCDCFWIFGWTCLFHLRLHQSLCPKLS